jgi:signal transduction histidine kinase
MPCWNIRSSPGGGELAVPPLSHGRQVLSETIPSAQSLSLRAPGLRALRRVVAIGAVAIAAAVPVTTVVVLIALRNQTIGNSDGELSTVARITAERTSQTFSAADVLIRSIADLAMKPVPGEAGGIAERAATQGFHDDLARLQRLLPQIDIALVVDVNGAVLSSSREFPAPHVNVSDAPFFQSLKARPDQELYVSPPILARLSGQWMLYLAHALVDPQGHFAGAVLAGISIGYFEGYFSTIDVGSSAAVGLVSGQGVLIARWPKVDDQIGHAYSGWNPDRSPAVGDSVITEYPTGDGAERRRVAVTRLQAQDTPLYLAISRSLEASLQPWRSVIVWIVLFAVTSLTVLALLTVFILRALKDEERWSRTLMEREMLLSRQAVELAKARDEAERASRARGEFLANMSHELRTPLNAILGFSEILQRGLFGPLGDKRYGEFASDIYQSGKHLLEIIGNILDLAKIDAGKLELYEDDVDIVETMQSCGRLISESAEAAGVTFTVERPSEPYYLKGDQTRLRQILLNLLSNAVKFTPAGQSVVLAGRALDNGFQIRVVDSGIGMTAEEAREAMQPFHQIDSSLARRYQGTGLGLPLTKSLVTLHEGTLEIDSTPGRGTTVTVWLPSRRPPDAESAAA